MMLTSTILVYYFREIGVPVERAIARSRLPQWTLEDPDSYVSFALYLEWLASCSRDVDLMEWKARENAARQACAACCGCSAKLEAALDRL